MKKTKAVILIIMICMCICACRNSTDNENIDSNNIEGQNVDLYKLGDSLIYSHSLILSYATEFAVDYYIPYDCENDNTGDNVFRLITIANDGRFLVVPDLSASTEYNMDELVNGIPDDIKIITSPKQIYLVASQVMDMFAAIGAMDTLRFSALRTEDWYISEAVEYMEQGKLIYAGKYSAPDYELILEQGCDLVIENTMIYHTPKVKEMFESFDIPVMVDRSSYEKEPLGRTEWVKLYGALIGHEEEACMAFNAQLTEYESALDEAELSGVPTVAFFYIASNGTVKVRKSSDYLPKMIKMAGGEYIFSDLGNEGDNASSSISLQMEQFYADARDADYIIYNSTIDGELTCIDDLVSKNELLANMKAVKENHVYCTSANLFQSTMETGTIIADIHKILTGDDDLKYIFQLQ